MIPFPLHWRNTFADAIFYDVSCLTPFQGWRLVTRPIREGSILVVYPGADERIAFFGLTRDFLAAEPRVDTITMAGVGSSALGTAALAKTVANALGRPAAGIVSGYGLRDLLSEGLAGFFVLGMGNRIRSALALFSGDTRACATELLWGQSCPADAPRTYFKGIPECETLLEILEDTAFPVECLVGHSKGNLNIANALYGLSDAAVEARRETTIITLGCGVELPPAFTSVHQFVGGCDVLGILNTPRTERHKVEWLPGKGHDLNRLNPFGIRLDEDVLPRVVG